MKKKMMAAVLTGAMLMGSAFSSEAFDQGGNNGDPSIVPSGEYWEATLGPGNYIIGVDIPVGTLDLTAEFGSGRVVSSDGMLNAEMEGEEDEAFWGGESTPEEVEEKKLDVPDAASEIKAAVEKSDADLLVEKDVLTYSEMEEVLAAASLTGTMTRYEAIGFDKGVTLSITGAVSIRFTADNCDLTGMSRRKNDGTPITLEPGQYVCGTDLPEGVYTIRAVDGIGEIIADDGSICEMMASPHDPGINSETFMNYTLEEGTTLNVDGLTLEFQKMKE